MVICQTLDEASRVPNVIHITVGAQIRAYQQGDALPPEAVADNADANAREAAIDGDINGATFGSVQPATIPQLKQMTLAQYGSWFDANFTSNAQLIALLRRMTLVIIRRVL
jgi:hypothetical protein